MTTEQRLCIWCKHFRMTPETPSYSDVTPGDAAEVECYRKGFELCGLYDLNEEAFRALLLTAGTCNDFEMLGDDDTLVPSAAELLETAKG